MALQRQRGHQLQYRACGALTARRHYEAVFSVEAFCDDEMANLGSKPSSLGFTAVTGVRETPRRFSGKT